MVALGGLLGLSGWLGWSHPASPLAMSRADTMLAHDPLQAVHAYDLIAQVNPWRGVRQKALYRSSAVYISDLSDPATARERLVSALEVVQDPLLRADTWQQMGELDLELRDPERAAEAFVTAHNVAPEASQAPERLVAAARARMQAGDDKSALSLWRRVGRRFESHRCLAWVAEAEIQLALGEPMRALELYQNVLTSDEDPSLTALARLGAATCMERMGALDEALAELDQLEDDPVRRARSDSLRLRIDEVGP